MKRSFACIFHRSRLFVSPLDWQAGPEIEEERAKKPRADWRFETAPVRGHGAGRGTCSFELWRFLRDTWRCVVRGGGRGTWTRLKKVFLSPSAGDGFVSALPTCRREVQAGLAREGAVFVWRSVRPLSTLGRRETRVVTRNSSLMPLPWLPCVRALVGRVVGCLTT